jgi:branched-chain amino acid transport system permease protein
VTVDWQLVVAILPQVVMDGLVLGFMYALIALGYTMVYGVLELINFAHSEIFMVGAFVGVEILLLLRAGGVLDPLNPFVVLGLIVLAGMLVSGLLAVAIERVAYRPLRGAPRLIPLISAIGVSFFLQDAVRLVESLWRNAFYLTYPSFPGLNRRIELGETIDFSVKSILVVLASLLMLFALQYLVNRTKLGKAIRAVAEDQPTASLMGINVNRIISLTFLIGGAMGGAAGVLFGVQYNTVNPFTGFIPGIKAFTAAVLGGIGNIPGAMVGGLVLGLLEAFAASYLSLFTGGAFGAEYKDIFAFSILILILIFRPRGLLGEVVRERA